MGMATIASDLPPYNVDIKNGYTGLLVKEDGWFDAMETLIKDTYKRRLLSENAQDEVEANHTAKGNAHLWLEAYDKLLKHELVEA
jgi:glycosyltransferase involved in cell wall biosynthesis